MLLTIQKEKKKCKLTKLKVNVKFDIFLKLKEIGCSPDPII